jgi:outer membrane protein OmpA-like peptidoglycan-associated protein
MEVVMSSFRSSLALRLATAGLTALSVASCVVYTHEKPSSSPTSTTRATSANTSGPEAADTSNQTSNASSTATTAATTSASNDAKVVISDSIREACSLPDTAEGGPRFRPGSSELETTSRGIVEKAAECLKSGALAGAKVRVVGRTDNVGGDDYNMELGMSAPSRQRPIS